MRSCHWLRDQGERRKFDLHVLQGDKRNAEHVGFNPAHIVFGHVPVRNQGFSQAALFFFRDFFSRGNICLGDQPSVENKSLQLFVLNTHKKIRNEPPVILPL